MKKQMILQRLGQRQLERESVAITLTCDLSAQMAKNQVNRTKVTVLSAFLKQRAESNVDDSVFVQTR